MKDHGVLQECTECDTVCLPQSLLPAVVCGSCPPISLQRQAEQEERSHKFFLIRHGELKCEDCSLQSVFAERVAKLQEDQRTDAHQQQQAWQLPDEYQYFCIKCRQVTNWSNT